MRNPTIAIVATTARPAPTRFLVNRLASPLDRGCQSWLSSRLAGEPRPQIECSSNFSCHFFVLIIGTYTTGKGSGNEDTHGGHCHSWTDYHETLLACRWSVGRLA